MVCEIKTWKWEHKYFPVGDPLWLQTHSTETVLVTICCSVFAFKGSQWYWKEKWL